MITSVAVHGYRSLRDLVLELGPVTLVTGANGTGKTSLYRALGLLAASADAGLGPSLARQGGLPSLLWAGPEQITAAMRSGDHPVQGTNKRVKPVSLMLGFASDDLGYLVDIGLPTPRQTMFVQDPEIKREVVFAGPVMRPASQLVRRKGGTVQAREDAWRPVDVALAPQLSVLSELVDPATLPEVVGVRRALRGWRFYDSFRTDALAPARQPQVCTWTPAMAADGSDLVPALQTILESAQAEVLQQAVAEAFDGARLEVAERGTRLELAVHQHGLLRPLSGEELSDGTLRFLLLAGALLSPRPASLLVLNEPEASLHPRVVPALARLVVDAARRSQLVVVSHSTLLADALHGALGEELVHHELVKDTGETRLAGRGLLGGPLWDWGSR